MHCSRNADTTWARHREVGRVLCVLYSHGGDRSRTAGRYIRSMGLLQELRMLTMHDVVLGSSNVQGFSNAHVRVCWN